jgi:hypothetical protein
MRKEDKLKPYIYKVYNSRGNLEEYSKHYYTKKEALDWYNKQGKWLEKHFNRELILIDTHLNLFTYVPSTLFNRQRN